eukprot:jgi/Picre1/27730/NNA_000694.t1
MGEGEVCIMDLVGGPATCPHKGPIMHLSLDRLHQEFLLACSGDGVIGVYRESQEGELLSGGVVTVKVWDSNALECVLSFDMEGSVFGTAMSSIATSHNLVAITGNDGKARLWDMRSRKHLLKHYQKRMSKTRYVRQMSFSEDGRFLFHPSENMVYVFDIVSGRLVNSLEGGHYAQVHCCAWNAKREHLYTAGADKSLLVWGMETRFLDADMRDKDEWSDDDYN